MLTGRMGPQVLAILRWSRGIVMVVTLGWMEKSRERNTAVTLAERTERGLHGETCRIFFFLLL